MKTEKFKKYQIDRRNERRQYVKDYLGHECIRCGATEKLHRDHITPQTKNFDISQRLLTNIETLNKELDKCQVLCASCHAKKTNSEDKKKPVSEHGTPTSYVNYGCRCKTCKTAWTKYSAPRMQAWRKR